MITFLKYRNMRSLFLNTALVEMKGAILALVYTIRSGNIRFISLRYASRKERRRYAAAKSRSK